MKHRITIFEIDGGQLEYTVQESINSLNRIGFMIDESKAKNLFKEIKPHKQTISPYLILPYSKEFSNYKENRIILLKLKKPIFIQDNPSPTSWIFAIIGVSTESYFEQLRFVIMSFGSKETLKILHKPDYIEQLKEKYKGIINIEEGIYVRI